MNSDAGFDIAQTHLASANMVPSVRLSAALYLTRFDLTSKLDEAGRLKMLPMVAQLLDQEVVGWWEVEDDRIKMASNTGGYGGMMGGDGGMMGDGGSGSGMYSGDTEHSMGSYGGDMPGGSGGFGPGGNTGPKPINTQKWDLDRRVPN